MLVGDVILSAREAVPDLPGALFAPQTELAFLAVNSAGTGHTALPAGTYYLLGTYVNQWGETTVGPEYMIVVGSSQLVRVNIAITPAIAKLTALNIYVGSVSAGQSTLYSFPVTAFGLPLYIGADSSFILATPPLGNSAFLPDSGGPVASSGQVFRWLSDALNRLSGLNGGVPDFGGFGTNYGQANYTVPGDWQSMSCAWYDGYPLFMGSSELVFRHNTITALSGMMSITQVSDTLVVEIFAQPVRTAGYGGLSVALAQNGTVAQTAGMQGWVLPFGLAQFGQGAAYEVVSYTLNGNVLQSLVRGLGGTNAPTVWPVGTPVYELNCMWKGMRAAQLYSPGMAGNTLRIPSSWVPLMHLYLLGRYRRIEQQEQEASSLMKAFEDGAKEATKRNPGIGDRQIQPQDETSTDVYPLLSRTFGGGIIP